MSKKTGKVFLIIGTGLIISALILFFLNQFESKQVAEKSEKVLNHIKESTIVTTKPPLDDEMPVIKIDGYEYIGYISIPVLDIQLPVLSDWSYEKLKVAPARHFGSTKTDDLVIAAHNYSSHFGQLKSMVKDDIILFTDIEGMAQTYRIEKTDVLNPNDVNKVKNSPYDLVLYTCTLGGKTRVGVFANKVSNSENN